MGFGGERGEEEEEEEGVSWGVVAILGGDGERSKGRDLLAGTHVRVGLIVERLYICVYEIRVSLVFEQIEVKS